jgi:hypothetical protein
MRDCHVTGIMSSPHQETAWSLTRRSPAERCAGICYRILARQLFRSRGGVGPGRAAREERPGNFGKREICYLLHK